MAHDHRQYFCLVYFPHVFNFLMSLSSIREGAMCNICLQDTQHLAQAYFKQGISPDGLLQHCGLLQSIWLYAHMGFMAIFCVKDLFCQLLGR